MSVMSEKKQRRRKALAAGTGVAIAVFAGLFATALTLSSGASDQEPVVAAEPVALDWASLATGALASAGFGFAAADLRDGVLQVTGDAPDGDTRDRAFDTVKKEVLGRAEHVGQVLAFDNAITVAGARVDGVPDAASTLGAQPAAEACQVAYNTLLKGRVINFGSASAILADDSKPLLDALADVARRCETYRVELGGHTDAKGDATANQALSERRAQSVADYLVSRGVPAMQLGVTGYGETQPVDAAGSAEADAKNRRIEFKVAAEPQ